MMHQGLDLSRFKKVSSDKKTTTLRHKNGHEIKVAHSALTPKMKADLESLEDHKEEGRKQYAEGTPDEPVNDDVEEVDDTEAMDPESPAPVPADAPQAPAQPAAQAPQQAPAQPPQQAQAVPPKPAVMPVAGEVDIQGQRPQPQFTPEQHAQEMTQHDLDFQKDMAMGRIKPMTYHDLFAKKDTLGKIGTIFGLILGGAGAGMAHGPNQALEMMNNEIKNDFEAQKNTQANAQNWYQQTKLHELQKAQIGQMDVNNLNTLTQMGKVPHEIKEMDARTRSLIADTDLTATTAALNKMKMAAVQALQNSVNKLPPGPQKDQQQQGVDGLNQEVLQDISKSNLETAQKLAARKALRGDDKQAQNDNGIDMPKFQKMVALSRANGNIGVEGEMNEGDISNATKEATQVADNRAMARIYKDSFEKLNSKVAGGALNPQYRAAELASLGAEIARATAGRFNAAEAAAQADGMFPSAKDWGGSRDEKYRKSMEYFENQEAGTTTLNRLGLKKPFPYKGKVASAHEGKKFRNKKTGEISIMKDGKMVPIGKAKQATK